MPWLLLCLQVLFRKYKLREVELKLLALGNLANMMCHKHSLGEALQMVAFSSHQYPAAQTLVDPGFRGCQVGPTRGFTAVRPLHSSERCQQRNRFQTRNDLPLLIKDFRRSLKTSANHYDVLLLKGVLESAWVFFFH